MQSVAINISFVTMKFEYGNDESYFFWGVCGMQNDFFTEYWNYWLTPKDAKIYALVEQPAPYLSQKSLPNFSQKTF